jgi:hypothetical protein
VGALAALRSELFGGSPGEPLFDELRAVEIGDVGVTFSSQFNIRNSN